MNGTRSPETLTGAMNKAFHSSLGRRVVHRMHSALLGLSKFGIGNGGAGQTGNDGEQLWIRKGVAASGTSRVSLIHGWALRHGSVPRDFTCEHIASALINFECGEWVS